MSTHHLECTFPHPEARPATATVLQVDGVLSEGRKLPCACCARRAYNLANGRLELLRKEKGISGLSVTVWSIVTEECETVLRDLGEIA